MKRNPELRRALDDFLLQYEPPRWRWDLTIPVPPPPSTARARRIEKALVKALDDIVAGIPLAGAPRYEWPPK